MLPTQGYFKELDCPLYISNIRGSCNRPYCHFKHYRQDGDYDFRETTPVEEPVKQEENEDVTSEDSEVENDNTKTQDHEDTQVSKDIGENLAEELEGRALEENEAEEGRQDVEEDEDDDDEEGRAFFEEQSDEIEAQEGLFSFKTCLMTSVKTAIETFPNVFSKNINERDYNKLIDDFIQSLMNYEESEEADSENPTYNPTPQTYNPTPIIELKKNEKQIKTRLPYIPQCVKAPSILDSDGLILNPEDWKIIKDIFDFSPIRHDNEFVPYSNNDNAYSSDDQAKTVQPAEDNNAFSSDDETKVVQPAERKESSTKKRNDKHREKDKKENNHEKKSAKEKHRNRQRFIRLKHSENTKHRHKSSSDENLHKHSSSTSRSSSNRSSSNHKKRKRSSSERHRSHSKSESEVKTSSSSKSSRSHHYSSSKKQKTSSSSNSKSSNSSKTKEKKMNSVVLISSESSDDDNHDTGNHSLDEKDDDYDEENHSSNENREVDNNVEENYNEPDYIRKKKKQRIAHVDIFGVPNNNSQSTVSTKSKTVNPNKRLEEIQAKYKGLNRKENPAPSGPSVPMRISHVPNVGPMLNAKKTISLPPTPLVNKTSLLMIDILKRQSEQKKPTIAQSVNKKVGRVAHTPTVSITKTKPLIQSDSKTRIPLVVRQGCLDRIFTLYSKYVPPDLAHSKSLQVEVETYEKCHAIKSYQNSIAINILRIKKEQDGFRMGSRPRIS